MHDQDNFFMWLQINKPQSPATSKQYINEIKLVSKFNGTDIDTEFDKDECADLSNQIISGSIPSRKESAKPAAIKKYLTGIQHYKEFRRNFKK